MSSDTLEFLVEAHPLHDVLSQMAAIVEGQAQRARCVHNDEAKSRQLFRICNDLNDTASKALTFGF